MKPLLAAAVLALITSVVLAFVLDQQLPPPSKGDKLTVVEPETREAAALPALPPPQPVPPPIIVPEPSPVMFPLPAATRIIVAPKEFCSRYGLHRINLRNGHWRCSR